MENKVNGPWRVVLEEKNKYCPDTGKLKYVDRNCWIKDADDKNICVLLDNKVESSASLLAAAPEMFKVLEWLVQSFPELQTDEEISGADVVEHLSTHWHLVTKALAKAKGEVQ